MTVASRAGRLIGILILLQMIGSATVNFALEAPLRDVPGFLLNAAPHAQELGLAVLLSLATAALWIGLAVTAFPILWPRSRAMALWLGGLAVVGLAGAVLENTAVMSMFSLSQAYATAGPTQRDQIQAAGVLAASARDWAHYICRILDGVTSLVFYAALFRFRLVPRVVAGLGLIAVPLMVTGVALPLFGHDVVFPLLAPLGLSQLILAVWLISKGFGGEADLGAELGEF